MLEILIADDHPVVRQGLKQIIQGDTSVSTCTEAESGYEVLELSRNNHYDLIILDISMPGLNGLEVLKQLRAEKINTPVLMLSIHSEEHYALRVLKAGAAGYLTKDAASKELLKAIKTVANGSRYISITLASKIADYLFPDKKNTDHSILSDREFQILLELGQGKRLSDIGSDLNLGITTVSTYKNRIMNKMGFNSNADIIKYVKDNKLIL